MCERERERKQESSSSNIRWRHLPLLALRPPQAGRLVERYLVLVRVRVLTGYAGF